MKGRSIAPLLGLALATGGASGAATPKLAKPPASCRGSQTTLIASVGRAIGASPLYAADFGPRRAVLHVANGPHTTRGWRVKVLFVLEAEASETVTVTGTSISTRKPLWFRIGGRAATRVAVVDPAKPPSPPEASSRWKDYPSYFFLPAAGCFRLEARWAGGRWTKIFAGGR
jgi:hypothetical protein